MRTDIRGTVRTAPARNGRREACEAGGRSPEPRPFAVAQLPIQTLVNWPEALCPWTEKIDSLALRGSYMIDARS